MSTAYAARLFGPGLARMISWAWSTGVVKVCLMINPWAPDQDTMETLEDVMNTYDVVYGDFELANGNGYTSGRAGNKALTGIQMAWAPATNKITFEAANPTWTFVGTKTFNWAVVYVDGGADNISPILGYVQFTTPDSIAPEDQAFTLEFPVGVVAEIPIA